MKSNIVASINTRHFPFKQNLRVLDFGFGDGSKSILLAKEGLNVTAADINGDNIKMLRKKITNERVHTKQLKIDKKLPFSSNFFDRIIANEVLEHIEDTHGTLSELYRVLKKNGIICISVPTSSTERLYTTLNNEYLESAGHVHIFTKKKLVTELKNIGFNVHHTEYLNFQFAVYWLIQSLFHVNPTGNGKLNGKPKLENVYWKIWGVFSVFHLTNLILLLGNKIFPKSMYVYASK